MTNHLTRYTLNASQLQKTYATKTVLQNVSFEIHSGQIIGLLGPNGAGKTTAFYMMVGLSRPDQGVITYNQLDITYWPMHRRAQNGITYLPQESSIFRRMSVEENIFSVLEILPLSKRDRKQRLDQLLQEFHITAIARQKAYTLSGGERRRVEIARALALEPFFLLLDEPFAGIDPIAVCDIQEMIQVLKKRGIGILITDHNVRETLEICDLGYILSNGKILEKGTPKEIIQSQIARKMYLGENFQF